MGRRNYPIEGVSGADKTAVRTELQRRGYQAIHVDRELAYRGGPKTGLPLTPGTEPPTVLWLSKHWIWDVEKVMAYAANWEPPFTFFCGGRRNLAKLVDLLDGVFVLNVDLDTMNRRIDERVARDPTDFAGKPEERERGIRLHQTKEDISRNTTIIDATAPLGLLHDIIEDTAHSRADLSALGCSERTLDTVDLVTQQPGDKRPYAEKIAGIIASGNRDAIQVKYADMTENMNPAGLALLEPERQDYYIQKYTMPLEALRQALL